MFGHRAVTTILFFVLVDGWCYLLFLLLKLMRASKCRIVSSSHLIRLVLVHKNPILLIGTVRSLMNHNVFVFVMV